MKPCIKCGSTDRNSSGNCRPCNIASSKAWRAKNRERHLSLVKAWRSENPEKVKEYRKKEAINNSKRYVERATEWVHNNPERRKIIARNWYYNHKEQSKLSSARWAKEHADQVNVRTSRRRAKKLAAIPKWFNEFDEFVIKEAHELAKQRTAATGVKWHVDHIVPLNSKFVCGLHCANNIQVITAVENISKSNRYWPEMP